MAAAEPALPAVMAIEEIREDLAKIVQVLSTIASVLSKTSADLEKIAVELRGPALKKKK